MASQVIVHKDTKCTSKSTIILINAQTEVQLIVFFTWIVNDKKIINVKLISVVYFPFELFLVPKKKSHFL